jgi:hypothetical protein
MPTVRSPFSRSSHQRRATVCCGKASICSANRVDGHDWMKTAADGTRYVARSVGPRLRVDQQQRRVACDMAEVSVGR